MMNLIVSVYIFREKKKKIFFSIVTQYIVFLKSDKRTIISEGT